MGEEEAGQITRQTKTKHGYRLKIKRIKRTLIITAVIAAGLFAALYFHKSSELNQLKSNPNHLANQEANKLIAMVRQHFALPNEKPTIATVEDVNKLKGQSFFKDARNGDKVLMYTQSKKAYLYRPSEDKVIEVAFLNINNQGKQ